MEVQGKTVKGSKVLIVGLAYKSDVDEDRESPSYVLMEKLEANVGYHDPHIPEIKLSREYSHFAGRKSMAGNETTVSAYDAAIISTAHSAVNHAQLTEWIPCVMDMRNAMAGTKVNTYVAKA